MRRLSLAALPALLALVFAACGGDDGGAGGQQQGQGGKTGGAPPSTQQQPGQQPGQQPDQQAVSQEEEEVRAAVSEFLEGLATRNAPEVCDALTDEAQRLLGRDIDVEAEQCEEAARRTTEFATGQAAQQLQDADAVNVEIQGDRATVQVSIAGTTVPIKLERAEDGEWQVSDANEKALREALP